MKKWIVFFLMTVMAFTGLNAQEEAENPSLFALGRVGVTGLYFAYIGMGAVADGYASGVYQLSTARSLAGDVENLSSSVIEALETTLSEEDLSEKDIASFREMIAIYNLLIGEARGLISYIEGNSSEDFQRYRKRVWNRLSKLMGLE